MAKKDRARTAVERAAKRGVGILAHFKDTIPTGPTAATMTTAELKTNLKNAKGEELAHYVKTLGPEKVLELISGNITRR